MDIRKILAKYTRNDLIDIILTYKQCAGVALDLMDEAEHSGATPYYSIGVAEKTLKEIMDNSRESFEDIVQLGRILRDEI